MIFKILIHEQKRVKYQFIMLCKSAAKNYKDKYHARYKAGKKSENIHGYKIIAQMYIFIIKCTHC